MEHRDSQLDGAIGDKFTSNDAEQEALHNQYFDNGGGAGEAAPKANSDEQLAEFFMKIGAHLSIDGTVTLGWAGKTASTAQGVNVIFGPTFLPIITKNDQDHNTYDYAVADGKDGNTINSLERLSDEQGQHMLANYNFFGGGGDDGTTSIDQVDVWFPGMGAMEARNAFSQTKFGQGFTSDSHPTNGNSQSFVFGYLTIPMTGIKNVLPNVASIIKGIGTTKIALRSVQGVGLLSSILTGVEDATSDHGWTWGTTAKVGIGLLTPFTPYGWVDGVEDLSTQLITGTSLTDRISNGIDNLRK